MNNEINSSGELTNKIFGSKPEETDTRALDLQFTSSAGEVAYLIDFLHV